MTSDDILNAAKILDDATLEVREVEKLTAQFPQLTLPESYLIQDHGIQLRLKRKERQIGFKMGLTSRAKQEQMNLSTPIYGVLTDSMELKDAQTFSLNKSIHAKIEPEIAFIIGKTIGGKTIDKAQLGKMTRAQALESCSGVCAAMEILDSRFLNFKYFSLPDVVADNCSSSYFVLSNQITPAHEIDVGDLKMTMEVDGKIVQEASSREISGHPLDSLIQLCEMLSLRGLELPEGSIVLAGAATQAVQLKPEAEVKLSVQGLGSVSLKISG